jgi:hypothetical protein
MEKAGLGVAVEPFRFQSYRFDKALLRLGEDTAEVLGLAFDPYAGTDRIRGQVVFLEPAVVNDYRELSSADMDGKIAVTTRGASLFRFTWVRRPRVALLVAPADFERLKAQTGAAAELTVTGRRLEERSANVVGVLAPQGAPAREVVILSAHHDSWKGPGASDNASGVAVLLELARYFAKRENPLPFRMRFVTFGAEERGMLGAKAYLEKHRAELEDCDLLFNLDTLGGPGINVEMLDGVKGIPAKRAQNQFPADLMDKATNDILARWLLLRPETMPEASNVPPWLQQAVKQAAQGAGLEFRPVRQMGSDHRIFAQAGIVATNVASSPGKGHTAEDTAAMVNPESLERVARLVACVVEKAR